LVGTLAADLPQPIVAVLISIVVTAWAQIFVVMALVSSPAPDPVSTLRLAGARLKDVLGFELLQGLSVGLVSVPIILVLTPLLLTPNASAAKPAIGPLTLIFFGATALVGAPLFARWLCTWPLIGERGLGTRSAMRLSWATLSGSTIACAALWLVTELPVFLTLAAPASVAIPLTFVDGTIAVLAQMGLAFAIYRQLFDRIVRSYPLSDEGRLAFEADSRALATQGYGVVSQIDRDAEREIAWSR
jgi:hypothetical protein